MVRPHPSSALSFVKNIGQWQEPFLYKTNLPNGSLYLDKSGLTFNFINSQSAETLHQMMHHYFAVDTLKELTAYFHAFKMNFVNANPDLNIREEEKQPTYHNYYLGNNSAQWKSEVPLFNKLVYEQVYSGIDYELYSAGNTFKYNFVLQPKANSQQISMRYSGCDLKLIDGKLHINTSVNEMTEAEPYAYQYVQGKIIKIPCSFVLKNNEVSFQLGEYNTNETLVIDPILVFATYSGSTVDNFGFSAAFDSKECLFSAGITTRGIGYPVTTGAFQSKFQGGSNRIVFNGVDIKFGWDITISKYDSSGANLLYATYLGGKENEYPHSLLLDKSDNLIVLGTTCSNNFPHTINAFDTILNANGDTASTDLFLARFNTLGALVASTFIGGSDYDGNNMGADLQYNYADEFRGDVIADNDNNYYIGSVTASNNFPTKNAFQGSKKTLHDGVVFKIDSNLSKLYWSTYFGGDDDDAIYSIDLDKQDNIYVSGGTKSNNFPVSTNAYQKNLGGYVDGFISKFSNDGQVVIASTYIGTANYDQVYFIEIDKNGNAFGTGQTEGNFPVSSGVYSIANGSQFLIKLDPDLKTRLRSTVFGSGRLQSGKPYPDISPTAFLVDNCDLVYVCGWGSDLGLKHPGSSKDLLVSATTPPLYSTTDNNDFYIIVFNRDFGSVKFNTYFGENGGEDHVDGGTNRFDKKGIIYASVCASCGGTSGFPTTPNAKFPTNLSPRCSNAAFKIDFQLQTSIIAAFRPTPRISCAPQVIAMNSKNKAVRYYWDFGDGTTDTTQDPTHLYQTPGTYKIRLICEDTNTCNRFDTIYDEVTLLDVSKASFSYDISFCENSIVLKNESKNQIKYLWDFGDGVLDSTTEKPKHIYSASGKYTLILYVNRGFLCTDSMVKTIDFDQFKPTPPIVPNVFTPNGDGKNDFFEVGGINPKCDSMEMKIYTRWGQLVFETKEVGNWWGGKNNTTPLPEGVYYYTLKVTNFKGDVTNKKGDVTIIR